MAGLQALSAFRCCAAPLIIENDSSTILLIFSLCFLNFRRLLKSPSRQSAYCHCEGDFAEPNFSKCNSFKGFGTFSCWFSSPIFLLNFVSFRLVCMHVCVRVHYSSCIPFLFFSIASMVPHSAEQLISASLASCKLNMGGGCSGEASRALGVIRHNHTQSLKAQAGRAGAFILPVALYLVTWKHMTNTD